MKKKKPATIVSFEQDLDFYVRRGNAYAQEADWIKALSFYHHAAQIDPFQPEIGMKMSRMYAKMERFELSNRVLLGMLWRCKDRPSELYYDLGCNFIGLYEYEWAMAFFQRYADDAGDEETAQKLKILQIIGTMSENDYQEQDFGDTDDEEELERASFLFVQQGKQWVQQGRIQQAHDFLIQIQKMMPNALRIKEQLAWVYFRMNENEKACDLCEEILLRDPFNIQAHCVRLAMADQEENASEIAPILERLRNGDARDGDDAFQAGVALSRYGHYEQAKTFFAQAREEDPYWIDVLVAQARNFACLKEEKCAMANWQVIATLLPEDPIGRYYARLAKEGISAEDAKKLSQRFGLPTEMEIMHLHSIQSTLNKTERIAHEHDMALFEALSWALFYAEDAIRDAAIPMISEIFVFEAPTLFRDFLLRRDYKDETKQKIFDELDKLGVEQPYIALFDGGIAEIWNEKQ